jgi:hypothetical protein
MSNRKILGLSLTRPWPFAFTHGPELARKRVENRSWPPPPFMVGQYLALHAAQSWSEDDREWIEWATGLTVPGKADSPHSQIFAVCRLAGFVTDADDVRLVPDQRKWFFGPYGWLLDEFVELVEPVPCKGAQKLWNFAWRPAELDALRASYRKSIAAPKF